MPEFTLTLAYDSAQALPWAEELQARLSRAPVRVDIKHAIASGGTLGVPELVIAFVLTKLAKAAAVAALHQLRGFLREKIASRQTNLRVRVELPREGQPSKKLPIDLRTATLETADEFCKEIETVLQKL